MINHKSNLKSIIIFFIIFVTTSAKASEDLEIKEMQQELRQLFLEQQNKNLTTEPQKLEFKAETTNIEESGCLPLKIVEINGATIFKAKKLTKIAQKFISSCTKLSDIQQIINHLNALYFKYGYITSRANLPMPQTKLAQEILIINIIEGKIAQINLIENNKVNQQLKLFSSVATKKNHILNLRDLEQTIDNFHNINNSKSNFTITAGEQTGTSNINIENHINKPHYIKASLDNSGTNQTGKNKYNLQASFANLLNLNDSINLSFSSLYKRKSHKRQSKSGSLNYTIPVKKYLFNYTISRSDYILGTNLTEATYYSLGNTTINKFSLERNLYRNSQIKLSLETSLTLKNIKSYNKIFYIKMKNEVGSRKLSIANLGLNNIIYSKYGTFIISPSYKFGLNNFAALNDKNTEYREEAQYEAYNFHLFYQTKFKKLPLKYNLTLDAQKSSDILFSSEAFYAGGQYSVRGFKEEYIQGDSGFFIQNNLNYNKNLAPYLKLNNSSLYSAIFFDYGLTKANIATKDYQVSGAGLQLNFTHKLISASLTYSKALKYPTIINENEVIYATISTSLSF